jgi:predicted Zn-ribbon and HTH transcriptional regulator
MIEENHETTIRLPRKAWEEVDAECEKARLEWLEKHRTTCKHCGYTWVYKGTRLTAACPNCKDTTPTKFNPKYKEGA